MALQKMWHPVSITGPLAVGASRDLLFGAEKSPWNDDWGPSALHIASCLQAGSIPYTNIAALAFKVIMYYSKDTKSSATVVWSSAHEVMAMLKWKFGAAFDAAPEQDSALLTQYMSSFDVLVTTFCLPAPIEAIVLKPQDSLCW